jgi:putative endonuclease
MYFVYILYSEKHDRFYVGHTSDLEKRLQAHNSGLNISTKPYIPWKIVGRVSKPSKSEAYRLEFKLKNLSKDRKRAFIQKYCAGGGSPDEATNRGLSGC